MIMNLKQHRFYLHSLFKATIIDVYSDEDMMISDNEIRLLAQH
jgi:hypothetical protein